MADMVSVCKEGVMSQATSAAASSDGRFNGFCFSKKATKETLKRKTLDGDAHDYGDDDDDGERVDYVTDITANTSTAAAEDLVIPLIVKNVWHIDGDRDTTTTAATTAAAVSASASVAPALKRQKIRDGSASAVIHTHVDESNVMDTSDCVMEDTLAEARAQIIAEARGEYTERHNDGVTTSTTAIPMLVRNAIPGTDDIVDETEKFKRDVKMRPRESTLEEYNAVPVTAFGEALLRGMGWKKGDAIGGVNKGLCEPIEYVPRNGRLGLGATPKQLEDYEKMIDSAKGRRKRIPLPGDDHNVKKDLVAAPSADGRTRHVKAVGEALVERAKTGPYVGCYVRISRGPHVGLFAKIDELSEHRTKVTLVVSGARISINVGDIVCVSSVEAKKGLDKKERGKMLHTESSSNGKSSSKKSPRVSWLRAHLRVRIVSEKYARGRYYNTKVRIVDVVSAGVCVCRTDDGALLEGVRESMVETIVPKVGGTVMVLASRHCGRIGCIIDRNSNKARAVIQFNDEQDVGTFDYDDICELLSTS